MPNTINTNKSAPGRIAKVMAALLADELLFTKSIDQVGADEFGTQAGGYSSGDTIFINRPARYTVGTNRDITSQIQDITEEKVPLVLNTIFTQAVAVTSNEVATDIAFDSFTKRVIKPLVSSMAQRIESSWIQAATQSVYNVIGTPGSTVFNTLTMMQAKQRMNEFVVPSGPLFAFLTPSAETSAVDARKGLFQSSEEIAKQYRNGYMGTAEGFNFMSNNLLFTLTTGSGTQTDGAVTTTAALTNGGTTIAVTGLTGTGTITAGTVFTVAGAFAVHPITKATLPFLQPFVVTANATAAAGAATLSVSPTIYSSTGAGLQNVSALPTSGAAVRFLTGTASNTPYQHSLAFSRQAFRFCSVPLMKPADMHESYDETVNGITIRVTKGYDIYTDRMILRTDFLGGFVAVRPEWAVRITA